MPYVGQPVSLAARGKVRNQISRRPSIRPLRPKDLGALMPTVGALVDSLYPKGAAKLLTRLEEALNGCATAHVAHLPRIGPIALASETLKGCDRVKLSTFWVDPRFRGIGVGGSLLDHRIGDWEQRDLSMAVVTVREERAAELEGLFIPRGFSRVATDINKYGEGQNEVILRWVCGNAATHSQAFMRCGLHAA